MRSTVVLLQLLAIVVLVASSVETLRARPWWPRPPGRAPDRPPARGSSPRERRWLHGGLALVLAGNVITLEVTDDARAGTAGLVLALAGVAAVVTALVRGPSAEDLRRYEEQQRAREEGLDDR